MRTFATPTRTRSRPRAPAVRWRLPAPSRNAESTLQRARIRQILHGATEERIQRAVTLPEGTEMQARLKVDAPELTAETTLDPRGETTIELPETLDGKCACENLDSEEVALQARLPTEKLGALTPGLSGRGGTSGQLVQNREDSKGPIRRTNGGGGTAAPKCKYKKVTVSHKDAWQNYPAVVGGGKSGGPFVGPRADWGAGNGIMNHRFVVTIDVDGDSSKCKYKQENQHKLVRRLGAANEVVDSNQARHDDTYPRGSSWIRFTGSQIEWMDGPGYAANLNTTDTPVSQKWTFWYSAWDSDGTGPLTVALTYDFLVTKEFGDNKPGTQWVINYNPGVPNSATR